MKFLSVHKRIQNLKSMKKSVKEHSSSANEILSSIPKEMKTARNDFGKRSHNSKSVIHVTV